MIPSPDEPACELTSREPPVAPLVGEPDGGPMVAEGMPGCRAPVDPLLFIHIMKTAGTSFRGMLEDALGSVAVYPSAVDLARMPNGWYARADVILGNLASTRPHRVLVGHFSAAMLDVLPRGYRGITFLRDPLQRSLSKLRFASRFFGIPPHAVMENERFIASSIQDYQSRALSMRKLDVSDWDGPVDDAKLGIAMDRLESLAFVGITERFQESCLLFDRGFGTGLATMTRHDNVGRDGSEELAELVPRLLPLIARDRLLYDRAVGLLEHRLQAGRRPAA